MRIYFLPALLVLALGACSMEETSSTDDSQSQELPLLPFESYFAPDLYKAVRVSPDGKWLSYMAPLNGIDNYFVAPVSDPKNGKAVTHDKDGNLRPNDVSGNVIYRWSRDSKYLIYPKDYDGNEAFDLWVVDIDSGENRNLTPNAELKTSIVAMSDERADEIAISESTTGVPFPAVYNLNLTTGEKKLIIDAQPGILGYMLDHNYKPRLNIVFNSVGTFDIQSKIDGQWQLFHRIKAEDKGNFMANFYQKVIHIDKKNQNLYAYTSEDRNTNGLFKWNLESGIKELIAEDKKTDLSRVIYHPATHEPLAYSSMWKRTVWHGFDDDIQADLDYLMAYQPASELYIENQTADNLLWSIRLSGPENPTAYYLYDRVQRKITKLFTAAPQYEDMALAPMYPYEMISSDGYEYVSYYTLPVGSDKDADGIPDKPLLSIMLVHGGPSDERAQYAFGGILQWFSNRGYAVFYVNYRGSPGFGKKFMAAQQAEWGGKMHRDLVEQVDWAVGRGIADKDHFAILGGSYGGYAALVGATMTPDVFTCAISIVGPSNLEIFMPHWDEDIMGKTLGGDPRTEEGRKFLRSRSPVFFAHQTKIPVLVVQGAQDSRVPQEQSDMVVEKMDKAGANVTYLLYPDEGHGIGKPHNTKSLWGIAEQFLANCLGGRAEPLGDKLETSTLQVPVGADRIPGLAEALANKH